MKTNLRAAGAIENKNINNSNFIAKIQKKVVQFFITLMLKTVKK